MSRKPPPTQDHSFQEHALSPETTRGRWSDKANAKAEIVRPLLDMQPIPPERMAEARRQAAELLNKKDVPAQTSYNWIAKARSEEGTTALERKKRSDQGQSSLHPRVRDFVTDLLLARENYLLAETERRAVAEARRLIAEEEEIITEAEWPTYDKERYHGRAIGPMLAWLRNLALTLMRQQRFAYVPDAWSYLAAHAEEARLWLVGKLKS